MQLANDAVFGLTAVCLLAVAVALYRVAAAVGRGAKALEECAAATSSLADEVAALARAEGHQDGGGSVAELDGHVEYLPRPAWRPALSGDAAEAAARMAVAAVGSPLVKVLAARAGTAGALRRLRRGARV